MNGHLYHRQQQISRLNWTTEVMFIHVSWTQNIAGKLLKLRISGDYFFYENSKCSYYKNNEYLDVPKILNISGNSFEEKIICDKVLCSHH